MKLGQTESVVINGIVYTGGQEVPDKVEPDKVEPDKVEPEKVGIKALNKNLTRRKAGNYDSAVNKSPHFSG